MCVQHSESAQEIVHSSCELAGMDNAYLGAGSMNLRQSCGCGCAPRRTRVAHTVIKALIKTRDCFALQPKINGNVGLSCDKAHFYLSVGCGHAVLYVVMVLGMS